LATVLQGVEPVVGELGYLFTRSPDGEDAARILGRSLIRDVGISHVDESRGLWRCGVTTGHRSGEDEPVQVLVVYGSTRGGTAGLAHMVADACATQGLSTSVRRAGDVRDLGDADAVIVGGAIYSSRWHPDAVAFVGRHRMALRQLPVWFFSSGPLDDSARSGALAAVPQVSKLAREIDIRGHMTFGGMLDKRPSGLLAISAWRTEGDFRDRRHVSEWVERIAAELSADSPVTVRLIGAATPAAKPTVVIKPLAPEPAAGSAYEDVVIAAAEPDDAQPKRGRLRRYLALDKVGDDDDEGLDLFAGNEEAEDAAPEEELVLDGADQV
jgi:menaquinone-dependent protoporphyrinogen oxidase